METENYLQDISEIKNMMDKSSRFISLSGLSGIMAGIYALIGAAVAYFSIGGDIFTSYFNNNPVIIKESTLKLIIIDLTLVALLSILTGMYLSSKKAKKVGASIWDNSGKRLAIQFLIPLLTGGAYILILLWQNKFGHTASLMLLFYGLALINASKYTLGGIKYLGFTEIVIGLACALFPNFGFWFWVIGFGFMHIIYGSMLYFKDDLK